MKSIVLIFLIISIECFSQPYVIDNQLLSIRGSSYNDTGLMFDAPSATVRLSSTKDNYDRFISLGGYSSGTWTPQFTLNTNNGNVGLGTTNPSAWFFSKTLELADYRPTIKLTSTSQTGLSTMVFTNTNVNSTSHNGEFHLNYQFDQINNNKSLLRFSAYPSGDVFSIQADGNIGVGTMSPGNLFHIERAESGWLQNIRGQAIEPNQFVGLKFTSGYMNEASKWAGVAAIAIDQHSNNTGLALYAAASEKVRIDGVTGNVGIGTDSPGSFKLAVNGKIWAQEVQVALTNPGPDYVFEPNYKLLSLEEIKSYIDQHKHLPEVPSAKEMETNGVNVSEMNMLLLRKIEELTLHVIEQNKQIAELKSRSYSPDPPGKKIEELMLYVIELKKELNDLKRNKK